MSISSEISRLQTAKTDIKTAIEAKGVTVPSSATIDTYDDYVAEISGGGGSADTEALINLIERDITSIDIPSGTTSIGNSAFNGCTSLTGITIPDSVTSIGGQAFNGCTSLTSITIPSSVMSIGEYAFGYCSGLTSVIIPDSVTSIGKSAFNYCQSLTSVTIPDSVTSIGNSAFYFCTSLTSLNIPSSVTSIENFAFYNCSSLTSITIPSSVTTIGNGAFNNCSSLSSVTVEATTPPALVSWTFDNTNDCPIYVPAASVNAYKSASGWSDYASRIQAIPTPTHQWVSYNEGDTVPSTTFYGVKLYTGLGADNEIDFGDIDTYSAAFTYNTSNNEWTAIDIASYDPIDISGYFDGNNCYTILFSDIGCGGMPVSWPMTGEQFEFNVDLYEEI